MVFLPVQEQFKMYLTSSSDLSLVAVYISPEYLKAFEAGRSDYDLIQSEHEQFFLRVQGKFTVLGDAFGCGI